MSLQTPTLMAPGEGDRWWFLNHVQAIKVGRDQSDGVMTVIEFQAPPGFGPPPHIHHREDELFYVLEGNVTFWCDGESVAYGPGGMAYLPKGLPHRFEVSEHGEARVLQITAPAQFDEFVQEFGEYLGDADMPEAKEPDLARLVEVCRTYEIDILG